MYRALQELKTLLWSIKMWNLCLKSSCVSQTTPCGQTTEEVKAQILFVHQLYGQRDPKSPRFTEM